jgi:hypothetical protein
LIALLLELSKLSPSYLYISLSEMNPCEGFLEVVSFHGGPEVVFGFLNVYTIMKKDLKKGKKKSEFNKVCAAMGKGAPNWVTYIIQIFCMTSAVTSSDNLVKIDIDGCVDRFFAYVLNYATIHQLTSIKETRAELESFRLSVVSAMRDSTGGSGPDTDARQTAPLSPSRTGAEAEASIEEYADDFSDAGAAVEQTITSPKRPLSGRPRPVSAMHRQTSERNVHALAPAPAQVVTVEEAEEDIYEDDYEDDFENNTSSVFSNKDKNKQSSKTVETVDRGGSGSLEQEQEYPEDDFESVASAPHSDSLAGSLVGSGVGSGVGNVPNAGSLNESLAGEYADAIAIAQSGSGSGSGAPPAVIQTQTQTQPPPSAAQDSAGAQGQGSGQGSGSMGEYADDFVEGSDSEAEAPAPAESPSGRSDATARASAADEYADDFEEPLPASVPASAPAAVSAAAPAPAPVATAAAAAPPSTALPEAGPEGGRDYIAGQGLVPLDEPLTRNNSEATFLQHLTNFNENNKDAQQAARSLLNGTDDDEPAGGPGQGDTAGQGALSRDSSSRAGTDSEASFVKRFDQFESKHRESFDQTAAANMEKNRVIATLATDHDIGHTATGHTDGDTDERGEYGDFAGDAVSLHTSNTQRSLGFTALGLPRMHSDRPGPARPAEDSVGEESSAGAWAGGGSWTGGSGGGPAAKKLKKTISFVEKIEYKDKDKEEDSTLAIGNANANANGNAGAEAGGSAEADEYADDFE